MKSMKGLPRFRRIRTKFLVPILALQLVALGTLGFIGYRFSSELLLSQSEREFRATIDDVSVAIEKTFASRMERINQLVANPIFVKLAAAPHYKSDADVEIFNFQKGGGLIFGEPEVGGLVNFPVGLLANEGNRRIVQTGLFPSVEYVGIDGFVRLHVYLGGSNDADFESTDLFKLDRRNREWFLAAARGEKNVGRPEPTKLYMREYQPITFGIREVASEMELITVAVPHRVGDEIRGVFAIATTPGFIAEALGSAETSAHLMLLDAENDVVAELGDLKIRPEPGSDFIRRALETKPDTIVDLDHYLVMHKTIPSAGWKVLIVGDLRAIYGSVWKLRNDIVLIMAISLAVMAALVFLIIRRLLMPVDRLTKASDRIAGGELGVVIPKEGEDEIGKLTDSFNAMSTRTKEMHDRLSRMNYVRRQLLKIISHELRTPLNSVVGFYDLMQEEVGSGARQMEGELESLFVSLGASIERSKLLVERLTRASSVIAGEIRSDGEAVEAASVSEQIEVACEAMRGPAARRGISLSAEAGGGERVLCPANAVRLMLDEALSNAIKHSPDGASVEVSVSSFGGMAHISVKDRGPGIPLEYAEEVVEPFFEVQDASLHSTGRFESGSGGLGLGLTIIMSVLRQYGGRLDIGAAEGGGAVVSMALPLFSEGD